MNIFQNSSAEKTSENSIQNKTNLASNPVLNDSVPASEPAAGTINPNLNKVPSGVKKPNFVNSPKKPDPIEPDAVPPKSYEAIIENPRVW